MKIHLDIHITTITVVGPSRSMHQGSFYVNDQDYKKDWEFTAAVEAYKFIEWIRKQSGYMDTTTDLVMLDNKHDITKVVRQIRPVVDDSNLPF